MTNYELKYSRLLADISEQVANFIQLAYYSGNYDTENKKEVETEVVDTNNTFENVDNSKVELVEYNKNSNTDLTSNKTLLYIAGAIILWTLLRGKK